MINYFDFHFLRPLFLLLLPLLFLLFFLPAAHKTPLSIWSKVIAPHLLPHLLRNRRRQPRSKKTAFVMPVFMTLLVIAAAGPTLQKIPTNKSFHKAPVIICLEVSEHMLASDLEPNRLKRAVYKIEDFLKKYQGAEVSLIAFAGDAHVVVPLSADYQTLISLLKTLSPELMPIKGVNLNQTLKTASRLQEKTPEARILVLTSTNADQLNIDAAIANPHSVMIWAIATEQGAPVKNVDGRFQNSRGGNVPLSTLNRELLENLSRKNFNTVIFSPDARDVDEVAAFMENADAVLSTQERFYDTWYDLGPYMLAAAMVIFLLSFFLVRESVWLCLALLVLPTGESKAFSFRDLFLRRDQQAQFELERGNPDKAAELFDDDLRKGSAYYRAKNYDKAIEHLSKVNSSDGRYNLGNAYAQKGQIQEAISAYTEALKLNTENVDAKTNKELLEKLLDKQKQQQEQQPKQDEENQEQNKEQQEQPSQQPESDKGSENKSQEKQQEQQQEEKKNDPEPTKQNEVKPEEKKEEKAPEKPEAKAPSEEEKQPQPKKEMKEIQATPKKSGEQLDKETQYYFEKLEQNNSLYLKRKFRYESEMNREQK